MRRLSALLFAVTLAALYSTLVLSSTAAAAEGTTYTPEAPTVDTIEGGPWNTSQGDPYAGGEYLSSELLPTFALGGPETTLGGFKEPNVAVYPQEEKVIEGGKEVTKRCPTRAAWPGTPARSTGYCSKPRARNRDRARPSPSRRAPRCRSRPTTSPMSSATPTAR